MKQRQKLYIIGICIITLFITSHLTSVLAIRIHLFVTTHPSYSINSRIVSNEFLYELNKDYFDKRNSKCYSVTGILSVTSNGLYVEPSNPPNRELHLYVTRHNKAS